MSLLSIYLASMFTVTLTCSFALPSLSRAEIGFNFQGKWLDFETRFKQLLEFIREHGHSRG